MASNSILSQGTRFQIQKLGTNGSPKTITGITAADPAVVTSTTHGLATGDVVTIAAVVGMTQVNGQSYVIKNLTANTFELVGCDSTSFTAYASGGTATPFTFVESNEHKSYTVSPGQASDIDKTTMISTAKEFGVGLSDTGTFDVELNYVEADVAQVEMKLGLLDSSERWFRIIKRNGGISAMKGSVRSLSETGAVDGIFTGSLSVRLSGTKYEV